MYNQEQAKPFMIERIVAALTYPTTGIIGVIWLVLVQHAGISRLFNRSGCDLRSCNLSDNNGVYWLIQLHSVCFG